MHLAHLMAIGGVAAVGACSGSGSLTGTTPGAPAANVTITIQDFSYSPATVTIKAGQTVLWINNGPSAHTVVSDSGLWDSGTLGPPSSTMGQTAYGTAGGMTMGGSFRRTFTQAGTFPYHCSIHPPSLYPGFVGTVTVTP
jgi:plastocyanin